MLELKVVGDAEAWRKKVRRAGLDAQSRAYGKLGKKPKALKVTAPTAPHATKEATKPEPKAKAVIRPEGVSRSTGVGNSHGFACPDCWGIPPQLRKDGFSVARHLPATKDAKRYRDTEFCDGQGKIAFAVMDLNWKPGFEPRQKMSAKKYLQGNGRSKK